MPKIEGAKTICRLCFDPIWEDQKFVVRRPYCRFFKNIAGAEWADRTRGE